MGSPDLRARAPDLVIRRAEERDFPAIWPLLRAEAATGETYTYPEDLTESEGRRHWMPSPGSTYIALLGGEVAGSYFLRPNQPGRGSHVANAGYLVGAAHRNRGFGRAMCEHSLAEARAAGYLAMQFNIVVSTNEAAVALWKKMGFEVVGRLPKVFRHPRHGLVDALVMHRIL